MNVDKAKKRIAKQVGKGFKGYPLVSIEYFGETPELATQVVIQFISEEGAEPQEQKFSAKNDVRNDETIQTVLLKIIERADAGSVTEIAGVAKL
ncbi:hypothetical protein MGA5115_02364 [Marinomonas gallaica]|uniref:Uncharacterized protein n=1 Tax=Marinomonas gallaica TaxID=1806667 RepID=A0A1C3JSN8_9GAMM|nr:hypothetical protein [Marinomonas gallaica]SBT18243.1 hypothetical protein MGA5115_02364 [Marinomonas gallaica]SBT22623.1 hypothetical protein MGA5116_03246 [Marinomonas gallaica]